jgi:hypothetical protein
MRHPQWLCLAVALCAGCTSYQKTPVHEFETHPDKFVNKNVRVHYDGTVDSTVVSGRTASSRAGGPKVVVPDSVVSLRIASVNYPMLTGTTISEPKMYGQSQPLLPMQVSLQGSRRVDVHGLNAGRTALLFVGVVLFAAAIYGAAADFGDMGLGEAIAGAFGGMNQHSPPPGHPPQN